jgi:PBP1b-binding outer membrane lipoprotein LpoB
MTTSHSTTTSAIADLTITALLLGGCATVEDSSDGETGAASSQKNQDSSSTPSDVVQIAEGEIRVEVFTASDLDQTVGPIIKDTSLEAGELWGLYWPV